MNSTIRTSVAAVLLPLMVSVMPLEAQKAPKQRELKPGWTMFGPAQDVELGRQAVKEMEPTLALVNDQAMVDYINRIGRSLVAQIPNPPYQFTFKVVNDPNINAFALPGGPIYINTGIILNAENEGMIAGVMGHEIGHVMLRHAANQMSKGMLLQGLATAAGVYGESKGGIVGLATQLGGALGAQLTMMKFSRSAETDSDAYGVRLMAKAGYNPIDMGRFFEKLDQMSKGKQAGGVANWMASHPTPDNRVKGIEQELLALPKGNYNNAGTGDFPRFNQAAKNMAPPPQRPQGGAGGSQPAPAQPSQTVRGFNMHRGRSYEVSFPSDWQVYGNADSDDVTIAPRNGIVQGQNGQANVGLGIISHKNATRGRPNLQQATQALAQELIRQDPGLRVSQNPLDRNVGGQPALLTMMTGRSALDNGEEMVMLVTTAQNDGLLYLVLICPRSQWSNAQGTFEQIMNSVRLAR